MRKYIIAAFLVGIGVGIALSRHFSPGYFAAATVIGAGVWLAVK